jgi:hypothetical protein
LSLQEQSSAPKGKDQLLETVTGRLRESVTPIRFPSQPIWRPVHVFSSPTITRAVLIYLNENFQTSLTLDDPSATSLSRSGCIAPENSQKLVKATPDPTWCAKVKHNQQDGSRETVCTLVMLTSTKNIILSIVHGM